MRVEDAAGWRSRQVTPGPAEHLHDNVPEPKYNAAVCQSMGNPVSISKKESQIMFKAIIAAAAMLSFGAIGGEWASAETPASAGQNASDKTSDRTPGNLTPNRTEGANRSGAVGADAGQTSQGTSDRTPALHDATTDASTATRANLFTQDQARMHLARLGYTNISELTKDENGAWRGAAMKDGKTIMVGIDVKGAVAPN